MPVEQEIYTINIAPEAVLEIDDIAAYNQKEGLALSAEEVDYLDNLSKKINRKLTDSEVFGFSQVNSEHCRHKIFNGTFVIDGIEKESSLFKLIKNIVRKSQRHRFCLQRQRGVHQRLDCRAIRAQIGR
jgi:phosphoribosylformylglycinamidine synthase